MFPDELHNLQHVVVTTDLSAASNVAVRYAVDWFSRTVSPARLTLLYVAQEASSLAPEPELWLGSDATSEFDRALHVRARQCLAEVASRYGNNLKLEPAVVVGSKSVAASIAEFAAAESVQLIISASHVRSRFGRLIAGSVTERLLSLAPCPMLVVPPDALKNSTALALHIAVTTDFSNNSLRAFPVARAIYDAYGSTRAQLTVLHVAEDLTRETFGAALGGNSEGICADTESQACRCIDTLRDEHFPGRAVMTAVVRSSQPAHRELIRYLYSHNVGLVVAASQGRSALSYFFLGSMTRHLLHEGACCLLIVPPPASESPKP